MKNELKVMKYLNFEVFVFFKKNLNWYSIFIGRWIWNIIKNKNKNHISSLFLHDIFFLECVISKRW